MRTADPTVPEQFKSLFVSKMFLWSVTTSAQVLTCKSVEFYVLLLLVSQGSNEVSVSVLLTKALKINHA